MRGVRLREHRGGRGQHNAACCRGRDRIDRRAALQARDDVEVVHVTEREHLRELGAGEYDDAAVRIVRANPRQQRHEAKRDVAEPAIPAEHVVVGAALPRGAQRALECVAADPVGQDATPPLDVEASATAQFHGIVNVPDKPMVTAGRCGLLRLRGFSRAMRAGTRAMAEL